MEEVEALSSSDETSIAPNYDTINLSSQVISSTLGLIPNSGNFVDIINPPFTSFESRSLNREDELVEYRIYEVDQDGNETYVVPTSDTFATVEASPNYVEYCYNVSAF